MEAIYSSESSVNLQQSIWHYFSEDRRCQDGTQASCELRLSISQLQFALEVAMNGMFTARGDRRHIQQHILQREM
jgi:hypothetical protein